MSDRNILILKMITEKRRDHIQRILKDRVSRKVVEYIEFGFVYKKGKDTYGTNGNVSVPPPIFPSP